MANKILIAEDLEDNRKYLQALLESAGNEVVTAPDGKSAFQQFQLSSFDLVMTDLIMPVLDGITLLRYIKKSAPTIPVIIVSAYQEIENVIEALRNGACDYITKPYEEKDIFSSIDRALRMTELDTLDRTCAGFLRKESRTFAFDGDPEKINTMARFLCRDLALNNLYIDVQSLQISLIEALSNAVYHGNLEMKSDTKQSGELDSFKQFFERARKRWNRTPYRSRRVLIDYAMDETKISYTIRDEGSGFDVSSLPDHQDPESFINPTGRGLLMIRTFCDEVSWSDKGNEIRLTKLRSSF